MYKINISLCIMNDQYNDQYYTKLAFKSFESVIFYFL